MPDHSAATPAVLMSADWKALEALFRTSPQQKQALLHHIKTGGGKPVDVSDWIGLERGVQEMNFFLHMYASPFRVELQGSEGRYTAFMTDITATSE